MATASKPQKLRYNAIKPAPVVLLYGKVDALAERGYQDLRQQLKTQHPDLLVTDIDPLNYQPGQLLTEASPSLFGEPRLLFVTALEKAGAQLISDLKEVVQFLDPQTTLAVRHRGGNTGAAALKVLRAVPGAIEVDCAEMKAAERVGFVTEVVDRAGGKISHAAVQLLIDAYADDLAELASISEQLVRDTGGVVTESHVAVITAGRVEVNAFKIADHACAGRHGDALVTLRHALATGANCVQLLAAINLRVRNMARVFGAGQSGQAAQMAPWQRQQAKRDASRWRETDLARAIDLAAETEWCVKGGSKDPEFALERYVSFIAKRGRI